MVGIRQEPKRLDAIKVKLNKDLAMKSLIYFVLLLTVFIVLMPLLVILFSSFKTAEEFRSTGALVLPGNLLNFENYYRAFNEGNMMLGFVNTIITMIVSLSGAIILGAMTAFVISRFQFKGRKIVLALFLFATLVPSVTTQVATFKIVNALGLYNTRLAGMILFMGTDIISIYIFLQFINGISPSLDESAMLEGASYFQIFYKIIFPLLKPAIVTVLIIKGVNVYNNFYTPFLYMPKRSLQMVSTALFAFKGPYGSQWQVISAAVIVATLPTLLFFLSLQKYIYNGFTDGSVK